jgi:hypothetical protein
MQEGVRNKSLNGNRGRKREKVENFSKNFQK